MTVVRRHPLHWAGILAGAILPAAADAAKAAPQPDKDKAPEKATTKPAPKKLTHKVEQPAEFVALAEKARKLEGVYARGYVALVRGGEDTARKVPRMAFETWTTPTLAKSRMRLGSRRSCTVYDGKHVYTFGAPDRGRRTELTGERFYQDLDLAAVYCDAAQGYANLASAAKCEPICAIEEYDKTHPGLKWFQVTGGKESKHPFLRGFETLKYGISPADGLVRVMSFEHEQTDPGDRDRAVRYQTVMLMENVTHRTIKADELKLPPEAATAKWTDRDTGKRIDPPKALIAPAKPQKKGRAPPGNEDRKDR